ncbi:MAG: 16S rRNA (uracil(1498)-N(3))-methyltransferase [bacterium]
MGIRAAPRGSIPRPGDPASRRKAVELGVSRIVPIATQRSVVRLSAERGEPGTEHWARIVPAAC